MPVLAQLAYFVVQCSKWNTTRKGDAMTTLLAPTATGREFARARLLLGVSARAVARRLGLHHPSLLRLETSYDEIAPELATAWRQALAECGQERLQDASRRGLTALNLYETDMAATV